MKTEDLLAYERAERPQFANNGWIRVEDQRPVGGGQILFVDENKHYHIGWFRSAGSWPAAFCSRTVTLDTSNVWLWTTLPALPEV